MGGVGGGGGGGGGVGGGGGGGWGGGYCWVGDGGVRKGKYVYARKSYSENIPLYIF